MKILSFLFLLAALVTSLSAQIKHGLRDEQGRHIVSRGFVVLTDDGIGEVFYDAEDYTRMVRMGANYQVIRLALGQLSFFPGDQLEPAYLEKLDGLVKLGREAGLKTVFKMTTYGSKGFKWENYWANEHNEFDLYLEAWRAIWERYQDDPSVVAYDLINEPRKLTMEISYDDLTSQYLMPYHRRLIDAKNEYSPEKVAICQAIFMNKGEGIGSNQYAEIKEPIDRENVYFSPHVYQDKVENLEPVMTRLEKEADRWGAPMYIGEWGFPTYASSDLSMEEQFEFRHLYQETGAYFDRTGVGTVKAWFNGTRRWGDFLPRGRSTWAIFTDDADVGTAERKYITDTIARPYPQAVAGDIMAFSFDHATRILSVNVVTDNRKGASRIFIGANRHYPDGFSVRMGEEIILAHNPVRADPLTVVQAPADIRADHYLWDPTTQQLTILQWPEDQASLTLQIVPGVGAID